MPDRKLTMQFAGGLVQHLGLQMYSGAVPAIAELISNSWDADASMVSVEIPLDTAISDGLEITVQDDGRGMTFEEVNNLYLVLGRNRRKMGSDFSEKGRRVLGRKGIGKLAGFGIASLMEIWTVRDGHLTAFTMDFDAITRAGSAEMVELYEPPVMFDRAVEASDPIQQGTLIRLKNLQLKNAVNSERFRRSMARRFSLISASFAVKINGESLEHQAMDVQFRFPESGWTTESVPGLGDVQWWAGFTKTPITIDEVKGISVLANGKLVQAPFYFQFSGGASGQHGLQYLTGEVRADLLDDEVDLVATDRASVLWEDPRAAPLLAWGQAKIRHLLREWSRLRRESNEKHLRSTSKYFESVEKFPPRERAELMSAIQTLAKIDTIEESRLDELVAILIRAYENESFMVLIQALHAADDSDHEELAALVAEWDILEAISTAQIVRGRVEVIRTFGDMIRAKVPEKPDMQDFVKARPWLLDPGWDPLRHETSLDNVLKGHFNIEDGSGEDDGRKRLDFFCLADSGLALVVELKRPGDLCGRDELTQIEEYVDFLAEWNLKNSGDKRPYREVRGCFVYSRLKPDAEQKKTRLEKSGIMVVTWDALLQTAERLHREFLEVVKARAPQDDPRIASLPDLEDEVQSESVEPSAP
jgi:hypothetical protein